MKIRLLVFVSAVLLVLSCSSEVSSDDSKRVFRYNEYSNISSLDPAFAKNQAHIWAINQLYNGLVKLNGQLEVVSDIADSWEIDQGGKRYRFTLKPEVRFHDNPCFNDGRGRAVKASDFEYSFSRLTDRNLAAPGAWLFAKVAGFYAESDSVFVIELNEAFPPFLGLLAMKYCSVIPHEAVEYYKNDFSRNPVGTGPFQFRVWEENVKMVLTKNLNYFRKDALGNSLPYLDAVSIRFLPDKQSEFLELLQGNIDLLSGLDPSYKDEIIGPQGGLKEKYHSQFKLLSAPYLNTEYLGVNMDMESCMQDVRIRKALNLGFDRKKMIKYLRNNMGYPALQGMIPKGLPSHSDRVFTGYQPDVAKELIQEVKAEHPNWDFSIKISTNSQYLDLCEFIQREWQDLGLDVEVDVMPPSTLKQSKATGKLQMFRASWIADYPDGENYLSLFYSPNFAPGGPNYTHFSSSSFDKSFEMAIKILEVPNRIEAYKELDSLLMSSYPVIPLYYDKVIRMVPNNLVNMKINGVNMLDLEEVKKN
ncbi:MAG: ABC transporter substrate-binding protein [Flavobacteriaceae bacterium]